MVEVKERAKVKAGTVVKVDIDVSRVMQMLPNAGLPVYHPMEINYAGKKYLLREPLRCEVRWDDEGGDFLWVEYPPLDICTTGRNVDEAIQSFNSWFDHKYERYNQLVDSGVRLGNRLEEVRCRINQTVVDVQPIINTHP